MKIKKCFILLKIEENSNKKIFWSFSGTKRINLLYKKRVSLLVKKKYNVILNLT
jgi:hypothetical protein